MKIRSTACAALSAALLGGVLAAAAASPSQAATISSSVYTPPSTISGDPGTVLKTATGAYPLDVFGLTKADATVTTVLYVSTGARGAKTAVSGTVIVPKAKWTGKGERPIVSYAPGTQGMADKCAPSKQLAAGSLYDGAFLNKLYDAGFAIAMTDYEGLGTPGNHPYVNTKALGYNVLDVVRAAQNLGYSKTAPVYLGGFSEGGGAAGGALESYPTYAPSLNVKAGYVAAPTADLGAIANKIENSAYQSFLLFAVKMLADTYPELKLTDLTNDTGKYWLDHTESLGCLPENLVPAWFVNSKQLTKEGKTVSSYLSRPDIAATLNSLKLGNTKVSVPTKVVSSWGDDVVPNDSVKSAARNWCKIGSNIQYQTASWPTHVASGYEAGFAMADYFKARANNSLFLSNCGLF